MRMHLNLNLRFLPRFIEWENSYINLDFWVLGWCWATHKKLLLLLLLLFYPDIITFNPFCIKFIRSSYNNLLSAFHRKWEVWVLFNQYLFNILTPNLFFFLLLYVFSYVFLHGANFCESIKYVYTHMRVSIIYIYINF